MVRHGLILLAMLVAPSLAHADPCTAPLPSSGTRFAGPVRYVGDGDSLCIGPASDPATWIEVRLALNEGPAVLTDFVDMAPDGLSIGMKVKVKFQPIEGGPPAPVFAPA
jgi:hypothetical protein